MRWARFDAAAQRLIEEIGVREVTLHHASVYLYRAEDRRTGRVEHEYDHVVVGRVPMDLPLHLDPAEVAGIRWLTPGQLRVDLARSPERYSPWFGGVLAVATGAAGHLPEAAALALPSTGAP